MKISKISDVNMCQPKQNQKVLHPAFNAKLSLSSELLEKTRTSNFYSEVFNQFKGWLSAQWPVDAVVKIAEKQGKYVEQLDYSNVRRGACYPSIVSMRENLEISLNNKKSGFCLRTDDPFYHSTERVVEDLQNVFNALK